MGICECMYHQDELGQAICNTCKGDVYVCECRMVHSYYWHRNNAKEEQPKRRFDVV